MKVDLQWKRAFNTSRDQWTASTSLFNKANTCLHNYFMQASRNRSRCCSDYFAKIKKKWLADFSQLKVLEAKCSDRQKRHDELIIINSSREILLDKINALSSDLKQAEESWNYWRRKEQNVAVMKTKKTYCFTAADRCLAALNWEINRSTWCSQGTLRQHQ